MPTPTRTPTLASVCLLALGVVAVWIAVTIPTVSVAAGLTATGLIGSMWWLQHRQAQQLRGQAGALRRGLEQAVEAAGGRPVEPSAAAAVVRERLEAAGNEARALRAVLEAIEEPVLALGATGAVVAANRGAVALLAPGSSESLLGEPLGQLFPDARALALLRGAQRGQSGRAQAKLLTSEGPRIIEVAAEPVGGGPFATANPPAVVLTLRDVTEQATAMQLKTDFVANASHELRTPLASIRSAAETLREVGAGDDAMREKLVSIIAGNAERLEELSRDLLDLSSLESPEAECAIEPVDLLEVAEDLRELFGGACAQRRVTLEFELDERLAETWTDARLVRLILRNLIDNAVKFAEEGSPVRVQGRVLPDARAPDRAGVRLEVIDRGIGIPLAQQQRVFERFYQIDAARTGSTRRRGTGLGLAIVKHALRALGGTIRIESVWRQGTTMIVELPGCVDAE
jgi:two-component system phosphate regulon sensor histidine kinase PhoR